MNNLKVLQKRLALEGIDYYIIDTCDPHRSEYVNDHYNIRSFFSGFTGSNGLLLVGRNNAWLWTDGRYFVQAKKQLYKGIELMKMGVDATLLSFLKMHIKKGNVVAFDGMLISSDNGKNIEKIVKANKGSLISNINFVNDIWKDRPADSCKKAWVLSDEYAGESASSKINRVLKHLKQIKKKYIFLSKLEEIMWLLNIRGADIECNPVCYSFFLLGAKERILFIKKESLSKTLKDYLKANDITIKSYFDVSNYIAEFVKTNDSICYDSSSTTYNISKLIDSVNDSLDEPSYIEKLKAVKNKTEISNIKDAYLQDSVVLTRFIKYIKEHKCDGLDELQAADILDNMRKDIPGFIELSFPTISAYGANAAMMHYDATKSKPAVIKPSGIYLVDSGGQYYKGTTDVTRSIVLGQLSDKHKEYYTRTAMGMLRLMNAVFIRGVTGRNIDSIAREPLWEIGIDYKCGTGHGIGYCLSVHEGPQNISYHKRKIETALMPGMIVSDEPGVYIQDEIGIRLENILLVRKKGKNLGDEFLTFEPLTYVPLDLDGIDINVMSDKDRNLLNSYHKTVYKKLSPFLSENDKIWLKNQTRPI